MIDDCSWLVTRHVGDGSLGARDTCCRLSVAVSSRSEWNMCEEHQMSSSPTSPNVWTLDISFL